ncbi:MAG: DUF3108 domain-containing protein [Verrucomicrobia bacterium]|nr:DUF3108 domain-containing protein [Verrucomicrobiota bacterium]
MRSLLPFLFLALLPPAAAARPALKDGEVLTFKVSWAGLGAGEIKISANAEPEITPPRLRVTTTTATKGLARLLLAFDAKAESLFDADTGRLKSLTEWSKQRNKVSEHAVAFDYQAAHAVYTRPGSSDQPRQIAMPAGDPLDLITQLVQTRDWDLQPGEKRDALVLFNDDFYELTIHAARYEDVRTPLGEFKTLVLEPRMDKTPPKGMFKKGSTVRVWIARDDTRRLPVKFEVEFKIGTGVATLIQYQPPAPAPATAATQTQPDAKNPRS